MSKEKERSEVAIVAKSIKENREHYISDMHSYINKLEKMSSTEKQEQARESLQKAGILTKAGKLSSVYR